MCFGGTSVYIQLLLVDPMQETTFRTFILPTVLNHTTRRQGRCFMLCRCGADTGRECVEPEAGPWDLFQSLRHVKLPAEDSLLINTWSTYQFSPIRNILYNAMYVYHCEPTIPYLYFVMGIIAFISLCLYGTNLQQDYK